MTLITTSNVKFVIFFHLYDINYTLFTNCSNHIDKIRCTSINNPIMASLARPIGIASTSKEKGTPNAFFCPLSTKVLNKRAFPFNEIILLMLVCFVLTIRE